MYEAEDLLGEHKKKVPVSNVHVTMPFVDFAVCYWLARRCPRSSSVAAIFCACLQLGPLGMAQVNIIAICMLTTSALSPVQLVAVRSPSLALACLAANVLHINFVCSFVPPVPRDLHELTCLLSVCDNLVESRARDIQRSLLTCNEELRRCIRCSEGQRCP